MNGNGKIRHTKLCVCVCVCESALKKIHLSFLDISPKSSSSQDNLHCKHYLCYVGTLFSLEQ